MRRITIMMFGLVLLMQTAVGAEMIRCRTADGTMVFTEDPSQVPADCEAVIDQGVGGGLSILPAPSTAPVPPQPTSRQATTEPESPGQTEAKPVSAEAQAAAWQSRAHNLVEQYNTALHRRKTESFMVNKRAAIQKMDELRGQKAQMLTELDSSPLSQTESRQVEAILAEIP